MYTLAFLFIILFIIAVIIFMLIGLYPRIQYVKVGLQSGFTVSELIRLWSLCSVAEVEPPASFFASAIAIEDGITQVEKLAKITGKHDSFKIKKILSTLYDCRAKVEMDLKNSGGIRITQSIAVGQRLYIVLKDRGIFSSSVLSNARELIISLPKKDNKIVSAKHWLNHPITVHFYRYGDASYVFETIVRKYMVVNTTGALRVSHTDKLLRTQKRKGLRCECNVSGNLFVLEKGKDGTYQRNQQGLKCCIEDVSEYGALVRIGGKGKSRLHVSLQFELDEKPVIMYGIVRGVEYNAQLNISRLHFECLKMNPEIKDNILSYVYKSLTERPIYEGGIF